MSGLQLLDSYLSGMVKEVLRLVEEAVTEYREEAARARREIHRLRTQLQQQTREECTRTGSIQSVSLSPEQRPQSEHPISVTPPTRSAVTPPICSIPASRSAVIPLIRCSGLTSQKAVVHSEQRQVIVSCREQTSRSEGAGEGLRPTVLISASVRVKDEQDEKGVTGQTDSNELKVLSSFSVKDEPEERAVAGPTRGHGEGEGATVKNDPDRATEVHKDSQESPDPLAASSILAPPISASSILALPRCPRCFESFPSSSELRLHLQQKKKTHCCSFCCKSFTQSADLRRHLRTHTGERPHQCGICSKAFSQRGNLRRHLRIHTGERPYCCTMCTRRFSDGDTMKKHRRTHNSGSSGGGRRGRGLGGKQGALLHR